MTKIMGQPERRRKELKREVADLTEMVVGCMRKRADLLNEIAAETVPELLKEAGLSDLKLEVTEDAERFLSTGKYEDMDGSSFACFAAEKGDSSYAVMLCYDDFEEPQSFAVYASLARLTGETIEIFRNGTWEAP